MPRRNFALIADEDVATKLLEQGDPGKLNKLADAAAKPGGREKFLEVYINSLLSGPQTHAVDILSMGLGAAPLVPQDAAWLRSPRHPEAQAVIRRRVPRR